MTNMYKILNIIEEKHRAKEIIRNLLINCGVIIDDIIIEVPADMYTYADKGVEVKIISPDFRRMSLFTKTGLLSKLTLEISPKIRAKGYTPAEYQAVTGSLNKLQAMTQEKSIIALKSEKKP